MTCADSSSHNIAARFARRGLAPLELVLALPLLLAVMALIVNFAHAATWKVRAATSARLAMWRHRPLWNADADPKPVNMWPPGSGLGLRGAPRMPQVDNVWNQPAIAQPWIKGPIMMVPGGYLVVRDNRVNEMGEGASIGTGDAVLKYPFLPSMGTMSMHAENQLMDSVWQYHTMGYTWNHSRRAKGWWQLEDSPDWAAEKQKYLQADSQMTSFPQRERLVPLDRDEELMRWYGHSNGNSDFYTKPSFCSNDPGEVSQLLFSPGGWVEGIAGSGQIQGVCQRMATSYLKMYQGKLAILKAMQPPPQAEIAQLEEWISELEDFLSQLP